MFHFVIMIKSIFLMDFYFLLFYISSDLTSTLHIHHYCNKITKIKIFDKINITFTINFDVNY